MSGNTNNISDKVKGNLTDTETRCIHYHSPLDIIAVKFTCCKTYYACIHCHEEKAGHLPEVWKQSDWHIKAILCGSCRYEMSIDEYLCCNYQCPSCNALFNPKCRNHNHFYFE